MRLDSSDSPPSRRDREIRAAVDVMFEALSHIQASVEASSEEDREASYETFKEALYERFDHILENEQSTFDAPSTRSRTPDGKRDAGPESPEAKDKFQKLWPAIARKE